LMNAKDWAYEVEEIVGMTPRQGGQGSTCRPAELRHQHLIEPENASRPTFPSLHWPVISETTAPRCPIVTSAVAGHPTVDRRYSLGDIAPPQAVTKRGHRTPSFRLARADPALNRHGRTIGVVPGRGIDVGGEPEMDALLGLSACMYGAAWRPSTISWLDVHSC
jgi:hypothetical protein